MVDWRREPDAATRAVCARVPGSRVPVLFSRSSTPSSSLLSPGYSTMPLDGHAHLVAQGWSGKGNGLRHGAITKPVTVVQKKTLAGIGKDRDEAFPFWDQYVPSHDG